MRTSNPNTLIQQMLRTQSAIRTPAAQFEGILDATIVDTDATNVSLPAGTCRVLVPTFNDNMAFGPIEYPGVTAPPNGTDCVVGFIVPTVDTPTASNDVRVLAFYGFGAADDCLIPGIVADGVTPNDTAIANAIAAANAVGKKLCLPEGLIAVNSPITINGAIHLNGQGAWRAQGVPPSASGAYTCIVPGPEFAGSELVLINNMA